MLTQEQIDQFKEDGFIIIENILSKEEIIKARQGLHASLKNLGIDHDDIINYISEPPQDIRKKSEVSNIFYAKFKMDIHLNEKVYLIWKQIILEGLDDNHPFGKFDDVIPYIDRICWRLPDSIRQEGGLGLHLDRRPGMAGLSNIKKYRPVQGFIALTNHYGSDCGGLRVVKGFHKKFDEYFFSNLISKNYEETGEFFRMGSKSYYKLNEQLQTLNYPAGSLVLWDNRLPHSTCDKLKGYDSREVIYLSYIPNIPINIKYSQEQTKNFILNLQPPAYLNDDKKNIDRNYELDKLNEFQKKILGLL